MGQGAIVTGGSSGIAAAPARRGLSHAVIREVPRED